MVHNKTLASQLYGEFKELFPENRVEYFISNFDFYQPEAYIPKSDTYIDKNAVMNEEIDMMRSAAMNSILQRRDTIVVCSVAAIYGLSDPNEYQGLIFEIRQGETLDRKGLFRQLLDAQYTRNNLELKPGTFRVHGDVIDIAPPTHDYFIRLDCFGDEVESIKQIDAVTGEVQRTYATYPIFPAYDHASTRKRIEAACKTISAELDERLRYFREQGKLLEAERLEMRTRQDMESMLEFGRCPGIENYSRHIDGRFPGQRPFCLLDYMPKDYLLLIDESHVTIPQIRGMYNGDRSRKETLVEYGFRLPSALDNRPLMFDEFINKKAHFLFVSATPNEYELELSSPHIYEQILRPTGLLDPEIEVIPSDNQVEVLYDRAKKVIETGNRVLITTLTKKMAEELSKYYLELGLKVRYMHSDIDAIERNELIRGLRRGEYDILIGINLLREGLDLPEVALVAVMDADKEGFLRSTTSLIQTMGRAARNEHGKVLLFANKITKSMKEAMDVTLRRRKLQDEYNKAHGIIPKSVARSIEESLHDEANEPLYNKAKKLEKMPASERAKIIKELRAQMLEAAKNLEFEKAIALREEIKKLKDL